MGVQLLYEISFDDIENIRKESLKIENELRSNVKKAIRLTNKEKEEAIKGFNDFIQFKAKVISHILGKYNEEIINYWETKEYAFFFDIQSIATVR